MRDITPFWVDEKAMHHKLAIQCLLTFRNLRKNTFGLASEGTQRTEIKRQAIDDGLPPGIAIRLSVLGTSSNAMHGPRECHARSFPISRKAIPSLGGGNEPFSWGLGGSGYAWCPLDGNAGKYL